MFFSVIYVLSSSVLPAAPWKVLVLGLEPIRLIYVTDDGTVNISSTLDNEHETQCPRNLKQVQNVSVAVNAQLIAVHSVVRQI